MENQRIRVVVTGIGAVTPVGANVAESWQALIAGRSGIARITQFDPSELSTQFAGEVKKFDPRAHFDPREARRLDRAVQFAVVAAREAVTDAGITIGPENRERVAAIIGSGIGGAWTIFNEISHYIERGQRGVSPLFIPLCIPDAAAAQIAIEFGARGVNFAVSTACATGTNAVGEGFELIRRGDADIVFAGGTEAGVVPVVIAGFGNMKALSTRNDDPASACRPFDASRDGFVLSEGAGILILEPYDLARARGAHIYAEINGYGATVDAIHWTVPLENGEGIAKAMALALQKSGLRAEEVDYINAHGTGTRLNDKTETEAIKSVFGPYAYELPISSTKSMTGHMTGAAGAVEAIIALKTIQEGLIPPTINYRQPDPECDLDYVVNCSRRKHVDVAMSNSLGMGGHNASLVFRRVSS